MASSSEPPPPAGTPSPLPSSTAAAGNTTMSHIPQDVIRGHILPLLDGPALASTSCASAELRSLSSHPDLWAHLCNSTWPSTSTPRVEKIVSTFLPDGPRSFFSHAFPLYVDPTSPTPPSFVNGDRPSELVSAVDIFYKNDLIFSKVVETETASAWFRCSPFRIDTLDPKETWPTPIPPPPTGAEEEACRELAEELRLSWILIDPAGRRAVNLSSDLPVSVQRHWLSGEVQARFAAVVAVAGKGGGELVQSGIVVTCGGGGGVRGGMHVREVSLQVEDMDGTLLNGKESLGVLHRALEGRKAISEGRRKGTNSSRREEEGKRRYEMFLEKKRERRERRLRAEGTLDFLCVFFGVLVLASLASFFLFG